MKKTPILFLFALLAFACNQGSQHETTRDTPKVQSTPQLLPPANTAETPQNAKDPSVLLQGTWQHNDDTSNYLVFQGNLRKETAGGMTGWDEEEFTLSDACLNDSDKDKVTQKERGRYISCVQSDLCWYIVSVDERSLTLSYMARGNNLTYKRVK